MVNIKQWIDEIAVTNPTAIYALGEKEEPPITYESLADSCKNIRMYMHLQGLHIGDTVSVILPNGCQTLRLLLGLMYSGLVVNPINLHAQPEQMGYILQHSNCCLIIVTPEWESRIRKLCDGIKPCPKIITLDPRGQIWLNDKNIIGSLHNDVTDATATALLMYTSGTTGVPKGVMLSQANLLTNAISISKEHKLTAKDRVFAVLPLYHINAFVVTMLVPLVSAGSLFMPPRFSVASFWKGAIESQCTWLNVVPTMISYLLEDQHSFNQVHSIRFCRSASAALPASHLRAFEEKFKISVIETMGLTETSATSFSNPLDQSMRKPSSIGLASGGEASIIDSNAIHLPDGESGEIVIKGPHVMQGYYRDENATKNAFTHDGWLRTGDLGYRDKDGFFFVTGRLKELIIKGGENIAPREIDEVLIRHPMVLDAAVVGVPDKHYGQEIVAYVVMREEHASNVNQSIESVKAFCNEQLGHFKSPSVIHVVSDLPRGPSGKIQRLKLLERTII